MTLEDFTESVAAGWLPMAWPAIWHAIAGAFKWAAVQGAVWAIIRARR